MTQASRPLRRLTTRQDQVLRLLATGMSNKDIAQELGIGVETVKSHVAAASHAIGARNRTEAAVIAATRAGTPPGMTPTQQRLHHAVTTAPNGMTQAEAANAVCLSVWRTSDLMRDLRGLGLVEPVVVGWHHIRWTSPALARLMRAERENKARRSRERKHRAAVDKKAKADAALAEQAAMNAWLQPRRVVVVAGTVPPPSTTGASSVFNLARL